MEYIFHQGDFYNEVLKINNINEDDLNINRFYNEQYDEESILLFKEKLLSLKEEKILLVGDYDCDGICATSIIKRLLNHLDIKHNYYIPSRSDGYGLSEAIVNLAKKNNYGVIMALDNGVSASAALDLAKKLDIKVLIIDHHEYIDVPDCYCFIHPSLLKKDYQNLSAGALSYLFSTYFYKDELSLVYGGLSTLSDMVGVLNYNRYLIIRMMGILKSKDIYEINLLNDNKELDYNSLSFNVIPKINAISRMGYNANVLVKYMLGTYEECLNLIPSINKINDFRKKETEREFNIAKTLINENDDFYILISKEFKEGLCGLLANKIVSEYNKPCLIFNESDGLLKGSGRSKEDLNLYEYLSNIKDIFKTFGGHNQACGLVLLKEDLDKLLKYINEEKIEVNEYKKDVIDVELEDIDFDLYEKILSLMPFGIDLKEPLIRINNFTYSKKIMMAYKYPKYLVNDIFSAISFKSKNNKDDFSSVIGYLKKDNYHKNQLSILIEELS